MKTFKPFLLFISFSFLFGCKSFTPDPRQELAKTQKILSQIEFLQYDLIMESSQLEIEYKDSMQCNFDFTSGDTLIGVRYAFLNNEQNSVFDGRQFFHMEAEDEVVIFDESPNTMRVKAMMPLIISPYMLKDLIPAVLKNPAAKITYIETSKIDGANCHIFDLESTGFDFLQQEDQGTESRYQAKFRLSINAKTNLPKQITLYLNTPSTLTGTYRNINFHNNAQKDYWNKDQMPKDFSWWSIQDYYKMKKSRERELVNTSAPDFTLQDINGESFQLSSLKGQPVLLEFWFPTCGACIAAVPYVNEFSKTFKEKGLKVIAIEFSEVEKKFIRDYIDQNKMTTPTLIKGKSVAMEYGVSSGPTFVLLDKDHKIVYFKSGFNEDEISSRLRELL